MNVDDISTDIPATQYPQCRLWHILWRQQELMDRYHDIERANGFPIPNHSHIHDRHVQARAKDMSWRVTEELAEATHAFKVHPESSHYIEELSDACHFLIELTLIVGWTITNWDNYFELDDSDDRLSQLFELAPNVNHCSQNWVMWNFTEALGVAMNCLKNKPWKTTHMIVDEDQFTKSLAKAILWFFSIIKHAKLDPHGLYTIYYKKSEVNRFRQRSNY